MDNALQPRCNLEWLPFGMRIGPLGASEIGILVLTLLPWLVGLALTIVGIALLLRLVRANERVADALEGHRVGDVQARQRPPSSSF